MIKAYILCDTLGSLGKTPATREFYGGSKSEVATRATLGIVRRTITLNLSY